MRSPKTQIRYFFIQYKCSKKTFLEKLRALHKSYESQEMAEIIKSAEVDKNYFWHRLKQVRKDQSISVNTIKYTNHATINDIDGILQTWNTHFDTLSKPKDLPEYDNEHFAHVNDFFREKIKMTDPDRVTKDSFNPDEISNAIKKLKKNKALGHNNIAGEHIQHEGTAILFLLTFLYNL